ncbi:uncharacterized protein RJT21DRAFT_1168 [Scheffersomyces amazonensis]|uniref:uncharacterized protein n=1 Tax=Scheffersomyces amazonensis TaxID=1078765 RepID=UPI00315D9BD7
MTLTKYQRGESMEGWNDCPAIMMQASNNSSLTSLSSRKRKVQLTSISDNSLTGSLRSLDSISIPPPPPSRSVSSSFTTQVPPPPPSRSVSISSTITSVSEIEHESKTINKLDLIELLEKTLKFTNTMSERESQLCKSKLMTQFDILSNQHLIFINEILKTITDSTIDSLLLTKVKNDIIQYMMINDGTSAWCTPLKKIIISIKS